MPLRELIPQHIAHGSLEKAQLRKSTARSAVRLRDQPSEGQKGVQLPERWALDGWLPWAGVSVERRRALSAPVSGEGGEGTPVRGA